MLSILFSTMLFAHATPHVSVHTTPHVATHVTTPHESAHTTATHGTAHTEAPAPHTPIKTVHSSDVHMSHSGYNTSNLWRNWMLFHMFSSDVSLSYRLDVKDKQGKLHTVHLTKGQYDTAIKAKHLLWVNGSVIADGKKVN